MKISRLVLLFVLLAMVRKATPQPFDDLGKPYLVVDTNDDSDSCIVNLTYTLNPENITFISTIVSKPTNNCTHHDLQYWSMFRGEYISSVLKLDATDDPDVSSGALTLEDIANHNGTSCLYFGYPSGIGNASYYYSCYFRYSNIYFNFNFGINNATGNITTDWINLLNPNEPAIVRGEKRNYTVWKPNATFPVIVGMLSVDQCANQWNNRISDLSKEAWITGTNLASNNINLHDYLDGFRVGAIWVRPNAANDTANDTTDDTSSDSANATENATDDTSNDTANGTTNSSPPTKVPYSVFAPDDRFYPFNATTNSSCTDSLFKYSDFISSLDQCKNGCAITEGLFHDDGRYYVLQTNGITTVPPARNLRA